MSSRSLRTFCTSGTLFKNHWKSTINVKTPQLATSSIPFQPKSLLVLATTNLLPQVIKQAIGLYDQNIQVILAGVDTIKGNRMGVSELWMDKRIDILDSQALDEDTHDHDHDHDHDHHHHQDSGVNITTVKDKNWKLIDSQLAIKFGFNNTTNTIQFPLANSLFSTHLLVTLFVLDPIAHAHDAHDKSLSKLTIELPEPIFPNDKPIKTTDYDLWVPLTDEPLYITNCVGNLIKSLSNKSAAKILENNQKLLSFNSKETKVFIKIYHSPDSQGYDNNYSSMNKHEIIAGGGGWGAKADTIVVAPPAKLSKGDRVELFMLPPRNHQRDYDNLDVTYDHQGLEFDCSIPQLSYDDLNFDEEVKQFNQFGCGTELGFQYNQVNYKSGGEKLIIL